MEKKKEYCYEYPRPSVTTDCVIFGFDGNNLNVLLIERGVEPFKGRWALPGGFIKMDESADDCARRELEEETGVKDVYIEQLYSFSDVERDPRGWVISIAYYALVKSTDYGVIGGDDASSAQWFPVHEIPSLAFDHDMILRVAHKRLKGKIRYQPIGFELLNEQFTIPELQTLYEVILDVQFDRRNFHRKILNTGLLIPLDEKVQGVAHRAARYYHFDKTKYEELSCRGFIFEI
ncbi:MAG: NUDIX hydrolase [Bacteroidota bacterium]